MKIQAISSWQNGQEKLGTQFNLRSISDNLLDSASFYYSISSEEVTHLEKQTLLEGTEQEITTDILVIDTYAQLLVEGNLSISGQDYIDWGKASDINLWAYQWAAAQLNLVLIPETV